MSNEVKLQNSLSSSLDYKSRKHRPSCTMKLTSDQHEISSAQCRKIIKKISRLPQTSFAQPLHGIIAPPANRDDLWMGSPVMSVNGVNTGKTTSREKRTQQKSTTALEENINTLRTQFDEVGESIRENSKRVEGMKELVENHEKRFEQENNRHQTVKNQTQRTKKVEDEVAALKMKLDSYSKHQQQVKDDGDQNLKVTYQRIEKLHKQVMEVTHSVDEITVKLKQLGQTITTNTQELNCIRYICDKTQCQQAKMEKQMEFLMSSTDVMGTNIDNHRKWVNHIVRIGGFGTFVSILFGISGWIRSR